MYGITLNDVVTTILAVAIVVAVADRAWTWVKSFTSGFEGPDPDKVTIQVAGGAKHLVEKDYQRMAADQLEAAGLATELEVVLDDGARVDIVTPTHAVEVDFAHKWAECIGQALYYGIKTGKAPVCLLIVGIDEKEPGVDRCVRVCKLHRIQLWLFDAKTLELRR